MNDKPISLACKMGEWAQTIALFSDRIIVSWARGMERGQRGVSLTKLSPVLGSVTGPPRRRGSRIRLGAGLLAAAAVVYFSALNDDAPLLAPLLALIGLGMLATENRYRRVRSWTVISFDDGRVFLNIPHAGCDQTQLTQFEEAYARAFGATQ